MAFWASKMLLSAVEMASCRRVPPAWIHSASGSVGISAAHDFLDALVARGFLKRESGSYRNMPETSLFLIGISHPI